MLRGNWRYIVAFGLAVLVPLGIVGLIYREAAVLETFYQHQADEGAHAARYGGPIHAQRACALVPLPERAECQADEINAARERERQERDLQAQLVMSAWTRVMALTALFATMVSIIGVGLVYTTFRETRRGADAARDAVVETRRIGEAHGRAYLSVVRADVRIDMNNRPEAMLPNFKVILHLSNSGATPAINVSYYCTAGVSTWGKIDELPDLSAHPSHEFIANIPAAEQRKLKVTCYGVARDWRTVQRRWEKYTDQTPIGEAPVLLIYGTVFYEDVFGQTFRSQFGFWLEEQPMPGRDIVGKADLPILQAKFATFECIGDRLDYIHECPDDDDTANDDTRHHEG